MTAPDLRSAMVFDTRGLARRPGTMSTQERTAAAPEEFGTEVIGVPVGDPLELSVRLEAVMEGVLASGTVSAVATGACVRCLEDVEEEIDVEFQELFAYADRAAHHLQVSGDDDDEQRVLESDLIDLEPTLRDAVVPTLPFQPVCRKDCPGLCVECGQPLANDPDHQHEILDPRWAALQSLTPSAGDSKEEKRN